MQSILVQPREDLRIFPGTSEFLRGSTGMEGPKTNRDKELAGTVYWMADRSVGGKDPSAAPAWKPPHASFLCCISSRHFLKTILMRVKGVVCECRFLPLVQCRIQFSFQQMRDQSQRQRLRAEWEILSLEGKHSLRS